VSVGRLSGSSSSWGSDAGGWGISGGWGGAEGSLLGDWRVVIVADVEADLGRVDVAVAPDDEGSENGLGEEVEDTVEDGLRVGSDDVTSLGYTPGNWIDEPESDEPGAADEEGAGDIGAEGSGMKTSDEQDVVGDNGETEDSEDEVTPLVGRVDQGTNEEGDNIDFLKEDGPKKVWPWDTSSKENADEHERSSDEPFNVLDIENLAVGTSYDTLMTSEFNLDSSVTQVGTHSEVSDSRSQRDSGHEIVEDTVSAWNSESDTHKDESSREHHRGDCEVPIRTTSSDFDVGCTDVQPIIWVQLQGLVSHVESVVMFGEVGMG